MCVGPFQTQITPVFFAFLLAGLLVACAPVTSTPKVPQINIPVVSISGSPTAPEVKVTPNASGTVQPIVTPTAAFSNTPTPSLTPTLTHTPTVWETPMSSPTVTIAVVWDAGIPQPVVLDQFWGQWLSREQKMIGNYMVGSDFGEVSMAEGPRFALEPVQPGSQATLGSAFSASPNGRWVVYGAVPLAEYDPDWSEYSTLMRLNSQDGRIETLLAGEGRFRWLSFSGWQDGTTLAMADYIGDGFYRYWLVDVSNGSVITRTQARGPVWRPNSAYLPVAEENGGPYRLFVLTRSPQAEPYLTISGSNQFARGFPPDYVAADMNVLFKDWLPYANRMLVQAFFYSRITLQTTHSMLMVWDVDARVVQALVYAALDGRYSPDGRLLTFITLGSTPLYPDGTPSFDFGIQLPLEQQMYLQLMDVSSRVVLFSLPVVNTLDRSSGYVLDVYDTPLAFSPTGRYLAFLTPGLLLSDQTGKLVVLPVNQESATYLSVLDLYTFQPLLSTPASAINDYYFSPDSDHLAFLGKDGNWYVLSLADGQVQTLTVAGGERLHWNGWSHNGAYLSFYEPAAGEIGRTLVIGPYK